MVDKQYLIDVNRKILKKWNDEHTEDPQAIGTRAEINNIISMVEEHDKSKNKIEDLIAKAAYLMAIVSWVQPFFDGNKRTGIISATKFLYDNGYDLDIEKEDEKEIRNLLYDIQDQRTSLDNSVVTKIIFYITKRIRVHEPRR
ncbi:MAG: Fic family protein [Thaumarchaeota archaeon]|nr:Fic family protein [Nitrososphaerota archaeon]